MIIIKPLNKRVTDTEKECIDYINCQKLKELNKLEVVDWSGSNGEVEYIYIINSADNIAALKLLDFYEEEEDYMTEDEKIDIAYFAYHKLGAIYWDTESGFPHNVEEV